MKKISFKTILYFIVSLIFVMGVALSFQTEEVDAATVRSYGIITNGPYFYSSSIPSTVTAGPLNVRTGPGTNYAVAGSLSALKKISVESLYKKSDGEKWYRITYNGSKRYVNAKYVAMHTQNSTLTIFSSSKKATTKLKTSIYTGPNASYSACGYKNAGNSLSLLGSIINESNSKWYLISYGNRICYIPAKSISITNVTSGTNAAKIINLALSKVNADYEYGAEGPNSFDCSGFVYWVVNNSGISGLSVPRTSSALYEKYLDNNIGTNISNAKAADIILFSDNGKESGICHAAIYYQDGKMIHASTPSTGVIISEVSYSTGNKDIFAIIRLPGV